MTSLSDLTRESARDAAREELSRRQYEDAQPPLLVRLTGRFLRWLLDLVAAGRLDPQIDRIASWREMGGLLAALGARTINGKAVARID